MADNDTSERVCAQCNGSERVYRIFMPIRK